MVFLEVNGEIKENNCQLQSAFPVNILKNKCKIKPFSKIPITNPIIKGISKGCSSKERKPRKNSE